MTSGCSLTLWLWLLSLSFFFSLFISNHVWLPFICSSLAWTQTSTYLLPSLSQSSVDHKEFKRCGPFDPYINAKVCTQRCWKLFFFFFFEVLLCSLLCRLAVLCCAWACSVCYCLRVPLCCRDARNFLISTRYRTIAVIFYIFAPNIYLGGDACFQRSASGHWILSPLLRWKEDNFIHTRLSRLRPPTMSCADKEETISSVTINGLASPDDLFLNLFTLCSWVIKLLFPFYIPSSLRCKKSIPFWLCLLNNSFASNWIYICTHIYSICTHRPMQIFKSPLWSIEFPKNQS